MPLPQGKRVGLFFARMKPFKSIAEQIAQLRQRGVVIVAEARARHCLEHHNYYRLSIYWRPFKLWQQTRANGDDNRFLPGATFEKAWELYHFDRRLRMLVMEACKRIEVSLRSRWAYHFARIHGEFGYLDPANFRDSAHHAENMEDFRKEVRRSKDDFVRKYDRLPDSRMEVWVAVEMMSFGLLSKFYADTVRPGDHRVPSAPRCVAQTYGYIESEFAPMVNALVQVRNRAAHHARLWNYTIPAKVPLSRHTPAAVRASVCPDVTPAPGYAAGTRIETSVYNMLVHLAHLESIIDPDSDLPPESGVISLCCLPSFALWRESPWTGTVVPSGWPRYAIE